MKRITAIEISSFIIYSCFQKVILLVPIIMYPFPLTTLIKPIQENVAARFDTASGYITLTVIGSAAPASYDNYFGFYLNNYPGANPITKSRYLDTLTDFNLSGNYNLNLGSMMQDNQWLQMWQIKT